MAIREALIWARRKSLTRIHIEADSKVVIQSITDISSLIQWENMNILKKFKYLSSYFSLCCFLFINRDDNQVADKVAKSVKTSESGIEFYDNFSADIRNFLANDYSIFAQ